MTRGRWSLWIVGGCAVAAVPATAVAITRGWVVSDPLPSDQEVVSVFPFLALLVLGVLAWLDQLIWRQRRPVTQAVIGFRTLLASALGLTFLFVAAVVFGIGHERPDETKVLPLPKDLTLVSRTQNCGSEACSVTYLLVTPDSVPVGELSARLWRHLEGRGWHRQRANASCRDIGWIHRVHQCVFLRQDTPGVVTVLLSTALDLRPEPPQLGMAGHRIPVSSVLINVLNRCHGKD
ncbi:hypothetical protein AB0H43_26360 [Hamadaea sp. NPDC050747]|uniref:hypothetical protein n=1 Tax=Hamadaea sp. NPDC050747 TaxID=3155789 RepID=UPI0034108598